MSRPGTKEEDRPPAQKVERLVLFRKEALDAIERYPSLDITYPPSATRPTALLLVLLAIITISLVVAALLVPAGQIQGRIALLPPVAVIRAPQDGTISSIDGQVGGPVQLGQPLITIDVRNSDSAQLSGKRQEELNSVRREMTRLIAKRQSQEESYAFEQADIRKAKEALRSQIESNGEQVAALKQAAELLSQKRDVLQKLASTEAISNEVLRNAGIEQERAKSEWFEQQTALRALEGALEEKELGKLAADSEHQRSISEIAEELDWLRHSEARLSKAASTTISAPIQGELTYLDVKVGDAVSAGAGLAVVRPNERQTFAVFKVAADLVHGFAFPVSSEVALTFDSIDGRAKIIGKVASLSPTPFGSTETDYKLVVALTGESATTLTEGMEATLNLERGGFDVLKAFLELIDRNAS